MKNNIVTQSQFYFSAFLSTFTALLFIDVNSSYQQIIYLFVTSLVNFFIVLSYKGNLNYLLKAVLAIYYIVFSVSILIELTIFMNSAIKSGPYWVLILIITVTILFTCVKGFEALSRAAVIITFFSVVSVLYIFASTVSRIELHEFDLNNTTSLLPSLILLFPSALYVSKKTTLKDNKKYPLLIYSFSSFLIIGYMIFLASDKTSAFPLHYIMKQATLGVFKGCDFLLLAVITVGTVYFISLSICCVVAENKGKFNNISVLLIIAIISLLSLYIRNIRGFFVSDKVLLVVSILMILSVILNSMYERIVSQHKICNKSKKN